MTRIAGFVLAGLLVLVATWWAAPPAYACSCAYEPDHPDLIRMADVIFVGTVVNDSTRGDTRTYTFTVDRVYKGQARATQEVTTHAQGPACGLELNGPGPHLVQARLKQQGGITLHANSCGGTREGGPPASLGEGYPPIADGTSLVWIVVPVVALSATFAFAALAWRRRLARPEG